MVVLLAVEMKECLEMKSGVEMRESHDLQTHLNRRRDFTGSLERISIRAF